MLTPRALAALVGISAALGPAHLPVVADSPDRPPGVVQIIERVGAAPRPLHVEVKVTTRQQIGTLLIVSSRESGAGPVLAEALAYVEMGGYDTYPYVYSKGAIPITLTPPGCPTGVPCQPRVAPPTSVGVHVDADEPIDYNFYVATVAIDSVTITVGSPGWRVRSVPRASFRLLRSGDPDSDTAQVRSAGFRWTHHSVEHYRGATMRGGRYGGVAVASIPCSNEYLVGLGVGSAVLHGGRTGGRRLTCSHFVSHDWARGPAEWSVVGEVTGHGIASNRLAVFDLPPR